MKPQVFLQTQELGAGAREDVLGLDFQHAFTNKQIKAAFTIEPSRTCQQWQVVMGFPRWVLRVG